MDRIQTRHLLEAGGDEQDLGHTCRGGLVSDEMSVITDRSVEAAGRTCAIYGDKNRDRRTGVNDAAGGFAGNRGPCPP